MTGPMVPPAPPCPVLVGFGPYPIPMHAFTAQGPALVAANDPVAFWPT